MRVAFIEPGLLRTELALEAVSLTRDGQGGHAETWSETATVFALLEPVAATARFGADQMLETVTHRVTLRARSGLTSGMRFRKGSRLFNIVTIHDADESCRYLVCRTREVGA